MGQPVTFEELITNDEIYTLAGLIDNLPVDHQLELDKCFDGSMSLDFYRGVLTGLSDQCNIANLAGLPEQQQALGYLSIYVAYRIVEDGMIKKESH